MVDSLGFDPERGDPLYKHWPFLITRDGASGVAWGLFYDSLAAAVFDLGCEHDNYHGLYRSYENCEGELDYYVFIGPQVADVTREFLDLTGRPPVPPRWTLGFAQTAMAIADAPDAQAQIELFIARCASEQIPVSAFHFGSGYTSIGPRRYVFNWNYSKFPDPGGLMQRFHDAGMRVVANVKPCLLDDHPRYGELLDAGGFVCHPDGSPALSQFWDGEGAHLDFSNPTAIAWWQDGLRCQVLDVGMDVAWNDNNEYGFRDEAALCAGFGTALPLERGRALQALLMTRASREAQQARRPDERAFSVTRAGCPGIQRHAQTWSGDNSTSWRSLKWNLRTGLQMGLSGMGNVGHDVGGFSGPVPDAELLIRWTQAGLLHPRFIMNSWKPDGVYTSPWLHPEAVSAVRAAIQLRYRLIPYLYSLMHDTGAAPLRPSFVQYPDDPACWEDADELMLGPFLLAAPVVEPGARARSCHLPAGPECWFDFWTGERFAAGAAVQLAAPIDRLPLVVPAGAILPMTDVPADPAARHDETSRCVRLFPGPGCGKTRFILHEDDGVAANGPSLALSIELEWTPERVTVRMDAAGSYIMAAAAIDISLPDGEMREVELIATGSAPTMRRSRFRWS